MYLHVIQGIKYILLFAIFSLSTAIGMSIAKTYENRVNELKEFKNILNVIKTKIKFTYEPIPEIFEQISNTINPDIGSIFKIASNNMKFCTAGEAWTKAIDMDILNISLEDKTILKDLSKMLGKTDLQGQISQIEITSSFIDEQIKKAERAREKNEKMYTKLGVIIGLSIVIVLI